MYNRLFQLSVGNVINWQDHPHRVCARSVDDHYISLELAPQIVIEGSEKKIFHQAHKFLTRPISASLQVLVLNGNSKLDSARA